MTPQVIDFGQPSEHNGYNPFSYLPENWDNLLFHGTSEENAHSILTKGFRPNGDLPSSSFIRASGVGHALQHACNKRNGGRGAVLAVSFSDINAYGIRQELQFVYLDNHNIQPEITAVCYVPIEYKYF